MDLKVSLRNGHKETKCSPLYVPRSRKGRVESTGAACVVGPAGTHGLGAALATVSGNAVVARGVQDGDSLHTQLHIPGAYEC